MPKQTHIEKLAQALDFRTESEYFEYCIERYINGNFTQCKELFTILMNGALCLNFILIYSKLYHYEKGRNNIPK